MPLLFYLLSFLVWLFCFGTVPVGSLLASLFWVFFAIVVGRGSLSAFFWGVIFEESHLYM